MPRYLRNHEIDYRKWDECISKSLNGNIYGWSWYLDIVCKGWDAIVDHEYATVLPLPNNRKYLIDYIYPPFFAQQPGIFSVNEINENICYDFLNAIPPHFKFIEMNLAIGNRFAPVSFSRRELPDYILEMGKPYDEIRRGYSDNHDRNVKKSLKNELSIFKNATAGDVIDMFRNHRGRDIQKQKDHHNELFQRLSKAAQERNCCSIMTVSDRHGIPCAGAVFFVSHQTAYFIFSGITSSGRENSAMHYLIDSFIRDNALALSRLDFEGSSEPDLARFYRGFGAIEFLYLQVRKNNLPIPWKWFKK